MKKITLALAVALAFSASFFAQNVRLLKDLRTDAGDFRRRFSNLVELGGRAFFVGHEIDGLSLFSTDGQTVELVKKLTSGCGAPDPTDYGSLAKLASDGARIFIFMPNFSPVSREIWMSDGTSGGTQKMSDAAGHTFYFLKKQQFLVQKMLFYAVGNEAKLFAYDGSAAPPLPLLPTGATAQINVFEDFFDGRMLFAASENFNSFNLWATDGTPAGTKKLLADGLQSVDAVGSAGGKRLLLMRNSTGKMQLFALAAGGAALEKLADFGEAFFSVVEPIEMPVRDGKALFRVKTAAGKQEIWATDGTASGTQFFFNCDPENAVSFFSTDPIYVFKNQVFAFGKLPNQVAGTLIFDGTSPAQTLTSKKITRFFEQDGLLFGWFEDEFTGLPGIMRLFSDQPAPAVAWQASLADYPRDFFRWQGRESFFLDGYDGDFYQKKWAVFDGANVEILTQIDSSKSTAPTVKTLVLGDQKLVAQVNSFNREQLLSFDGTPTGRVVLAEFGQKTSSSSHDLKPSGSPERGFFYGDVVEPSGNFAQNRLWVSDGSEAGTRPVAFPPDVLAMWSSGLEIDGKLWLAAQETNDLFALWRTDGATTEKVADVPGASLFPLDVQAWDGERAWFWAHYNELWRSDGTENGTFRVVEGANAQFPIQVLGKKALFSKETASNGVELWVSDGTAAGTKMLVDALGGPASGLFSAPHIGQNAAFFAVRNAASSLSVWRTDGAAADQIVFWALPDFVNDIRFLGNAGAKTIFSASIYDQSTSQSRTEVWASDGFLHEKIADDLPVEPFKKAAAFGQKLAFSAYEILPPNVAVRQIWTTDGTAAGTQKVEIKPCATTASGFWGIENLTEAGGEIWFLGQPCPSGPLEIWHSDGTENGTKKLETDSCYGPREPFQLTRFGPDRLLFSAIDPSRGREPFVIETAKISTDEPVFSENQKPRSAFSAAPNPTDGLLFLKNEKGAGVVIFEKVWLTDALGRTVFEQKNHRSSEPIWLGDLPDGVYFLFQKQEKKPAEAVGTVLKKG